MTLASASEATRPGRVVLVIRTLVAGGAERSTVLTANALRGAGHTVDVVTLDALGPLRTELDPGVGVRCLSAQGWFRKVLRFGRELRRDPPTVVFANLTTSNLVALVAAWGFRTGTPVIAIERNPVPPPSWKLPRRVGYGLLVPLFYRRALRVVGVSRGIAEHIRRYARLDRDRVAVIYNPVPGETIRRRAEAPAGHPWFAEDAVPVFVSVRRLAPAKDYDTLLRAFAIFRASRPGRLLVLGDGDAREPTEALARTLGIEDAVDFLGHVTNPYPYMARATALVSSSLTEGLPRNLIEAMCLGTPVVSTDCPHGPAEILENGRWGELVPLRDPSALADGLARAVDRPVDARARAEAFRVDRATAAYERLVQEAAALGRPSGGH